MKLSTKCRAVISWKMTKLNWYSYGDLRPVPHQQFLSPCDGRLFRNHQKKFYYDPASNHLIQLRCLVAALCLNTTFVILSVCYEWWSNWASFCQCLTNIMVTIMTIVTKEQILNHMMTKRQPFAYFYRLSVLRQRRRVLSTYYIQEQRQKQRVKKLSNYGEILHMWTCECCTWMLTMLKHVRYCCRM